MKDSEFFAQLANGTEATVASWANAFKTQLGSDGELSFSDGCVYAIGSAGRGELGISSDLAKRDSGSGGTSQNDAAVQPSRSVE